MTDNKNKGTQKSDIRAQYNKENKTEETTGNKNITYVNTEPKAQENTLADRQQNELKTKPVKHKSKYLNARKINPSHKVLSSNNYR